MKTFLKRQLLVIGCLTGLLFITKPAAANTYVVTSTADSGPGTLRQAILDANANPGADTIVFLIALAGNNFEGIAPANYAVIEINTALPAISEALLLNGSSQTNTNTGVMPGRTVGTDAIVQSDIDYPDVYLVPSAIFPFPGNSIGMVGNGLTIDAANVTIRGMAISGFGNTSLNGGNASGNGDVQVVRSASSRTINFSISDCFISCDPLGNFPTLAHRRTRGNGVLIAGHNFTGIITNNYIAYSGTYGIQFNGNIDNNSVGPAGTTLINRNWVVSENQLINITSNPVINVQKISDAINLMKCVGFRVVNNYLSDAEQAGIDLGYNADSNYIANNTITNYTKTGGAAPQCGIRIGLCSQSDTLYRNLIHNNTGTGFRGGIWIDESELTQTGVDIKPNSENKIIENVLYGNNSSAIVLSNNSTGSCINNLISRNSTYSNAGLGIDLEYNATSGPTAVSVNDNGDVDAGTNNTQNFPIIDSARRLSANMYGIYGKVTAGSTIEFFINDGEENKHGLLTLNYGEGKTYIGSLVEGSTDDGASGTGSYNVDGNIAAGNVNLFFATITYNGAVTSLDSITSTATLANNTSEFGPTVNILQLLGCTLTGFTAAWNKNEVSLNWKAICDTKFQYFEIEHSVDGKNFSRLKTIASVERAVIVSYDFTHKGIKEGTHFYRLKMVSVNNDVKYSNLVYIKANQQVSGLMCNSVFTNQIDMVLQIEQQETVAVQLFSESGKLVRYKEISGRTGTNFIRFDDVRQLPAGGYILQIRKKSGSVTRKLMRI
jgi:hypothetical protein